MSKSSNQSATLVGRRAPDFEVPCTPAPQHPDPIARLSDYRDRWLILMFYPRDFSLVCPTELLALSNRYDEFVEHGADVLAISTDTIESHEQWLTKPRSKGGLGEMRYPLGSDTRGLVATAYGVYLDSQHIAIRGLFIVDPNSVVQMQVVHNLSVGRRSDEILRVLNALQVGGLCAENWSPGQAPVEAASEVKPGSIVGHYRIEEKIGDGGFAAVYQAFDRQLRRKVALKILKSVDERTPSIQQEARAAAALNHPNVCTVYGMDDGEGIPMIVMEYLTGRPLKQAIDDGPMLPERVSAIALQVARGMAAAHDAGVVHGDLKPANIMLTDDETVKILDFGLANRHHVAKVAESTVFVNRSSLGGLAGTPAYMSPEQADGGRPTIASDVFSFGLVIYEMLTGRRAFAETQALKLLGQIRSVEPGVLTNDVPEPFSTLLRRMLVRDSQARTITMHEVEGSLRGAAKSGST